MTKLPKMYEPYLEEFRKKVELERRLDENDTSTDFSAADFWYDVILEGTSDATISASNDDNFELPPYYDEQLYKKGQEFFTNNMYPILFGELFGLITLLAAPASKILAMTNKSSTPSTALKRYLETFLHVFTWYQDDLKPGSRAWNSLKKVRAMHNSASKKSAATLNYPINQIEMTCTLFGFMGYPLVRSEMVGVHGATEEELAGFVHLWRVIGHLLGVEDRFNICRGSVRETRAVCDMVIKTLMLPLMEDPCEGFEVLFTAITDNAKAFYPFFTHDTYIRYIHMLLEDTRDVRLEKKCLKPLTFWRKVELRRMSLLFWLLRFSVVRAAHKYVVYFGMWLLKS